jgi:hypothetical protein
LLKDAPPSLLIGVALIAGIFIGLTAFFGLAVLLVLDRKIAGYIGLADFLLPRIVELWAPQNK